MIGTPSISIKALFFPIRLLFPPERIMPDMLVIASKKVPER
jgi:hypothetical protein